MAADKDYEFFKVIQGYLDRAAKVVDCRRTCSGSSRSPRMRSSSTSLSGWTTASCDCSRATASSTTTCSGLQGGMRYTRPSGWTI